MSTTREELIRHAMIAILQDALAGVAEGGIGDHEAYYITFDTRWPGVEYPRDFMPGANEFPIVIELQFWNLQVTTESFSVTLRFAGKPERLYVPWGAVIGWMNPHVPVAWGSRLQSAASKVPAAPPRRFAVVPKGEPA